MVSRRPRWFVDVSMEGPSNVTLLDFDTISNLRRWLGGAIGGAPSVGWVALWCLYIFSRSFVSALFFYAKVSFSLASRSGALLANLVFSMSKKTRTYYSRSRVSISSPFYLLDSIGVSRVVGGFPREELCSDSVGGIGTSSDGIGRR